MSMTELLLDVLTLDALQNLKTEYDEPEICPECGGIKNVIGRMHDDSYRFAHCQDCGLYFETPIVDGVVQTLKEMVIE